ncbi:crotonyl-CoA carboxylase/reductase [Streptomyces stramineus]|uniref:Crotonyl-CoA carboxylase/reductase n=1 Tax=Streptomyces stramineus TaxID=173861 RepID=A0ABN0ZC66_9ACTN
MCALADALADPDLPPAEVGRLPLPRSFRALTVRRKEAGVFAGVPREQRDPVVSLRVEDVPVPEVGCGEVLVAVMASSVNHNTVWSALFDPQPTFRFLEDYARTSPAGRRHDLPYHVLGSDLAGIVLRTGPGVHRPRPGDHVVAHCLSTEPVDAAGSGDAVLGSRRRIWGYETNFGGLAEISLLRADQLLPKAGHLTWEEAACNGLAGSTAYRQLVSGNGAGMKQGDTVLIWGAAGGLGSYATQYALGGGGIPVCVVSSARKAALCRAMGAELVIDRDAEQYRFWKDADTPDPREWRRFARHIRALTGGDDPDIVVEHPGRETFGASVYAARRGGTITTCASTTGPWHLYDNRYLWTELKRVVGVHCADHREAAEANRLVCRGRVHPPLSATYSLASAPVAVRAVARGAHHGKVAVRCLAARDGQGVRDHALRAGLLPALRRFLPDGQAPATG